MIDERPPKQDSSEDKGTQQERANMGSGELKSARICLVQ